jgi:hypothetical protein
MPPDNLSKRKATYASLQHSPYRAKASLKGAADEVKTYKKQYNEAA